MNSTHPAPTISYPARMARYFGPATMEMATARLYEPTPRFFEPAAGRLFAPADPLGGDPATALSSSPG